MPRFMSKLAILALLALFSVAGCGGGDSPEAAGPSDVQTHNDADVAFATAMIPHHGQALEMASIALDRAQSPDVVKLAQQISDAQGPEIEQMSNWLEVWGQAVPDSTMGAMSGMEMPGLMSAKEMQQLRQASGATFDQLWLEMMITHHQGAIEMAQTELSDGSNTDAKQLAQNVIDAQQAEIESMQEILNGSGS